MAIQDDDSRKASTGMMSLMKLLNAYEEGFDTDHVNQESLAPLEDQIATTAENTTSGKYIWDIDSTEASSHPDVPKTGIEDIREMIRALQYELKAKSTQITELKTILARKRLSKESNVSKLREDWDKKIDSLGREFGKKRQMLQRHIQQNQEYISDSNRKKDSIEKERHKIEQQMPSLCRQLEREGTEELSREGQRWKAEEKARLVKLAKAKGADMKAEAAKTLEPELRKLVQDHNEQKILLRNNIESKLQLRREEVEEELRIKLNNEQQKVDNEVEGEVTHVDESYKEKNAQLNVQLKRKLEEVEMKTIREREKFLASYRISVEEHKTRSRKQEKIRNEECATEASLKKEESHQTLQQMKSNVAKRVEGEKCRLDANIIEWKNHETIRLSEELCSLMKAEEDGIRVKVAKDLSVIIEKLQEKFEARKIDTKTRHEAEMKVKRERLEIVLKQFIQRCTFTQKGYEELKQEESILRNELKLTRARMVASLENQHKVESTLKVEKNLDAEKNREQKIRRGNEEKELRRTKLALAMTTKSLHHSKYKLGENEEALEIEIQALQEVNQNEIENVQVKIDQILGIKRQCLSQKQEELSSLQQIVVDMEAKLSRMRHAEILK